MYNRSAGGWAKHYDFILLDCVCLALSLFLAVLLRNHFSLASYNNIYVSLSIVAILVDFGACIIFSTMKDVLKRGYVGELWATLKQVLYVLFGLLVYMFALKLGDTYSRFTIFTTMPLYGASAYILRVLWKRHLFYRFDRAKGTKSLLVLVGKENAQELIREIQERNYSGYRITGLVYKSLPEDAAGPEGIPVVADYDTMIEYVNSHWVDEVLIHKKASDELPGGLLDVLISMGVSVHMSMEKPSIDLGVKQVLGTVGGIPVITNSMNYMTYRQAKMKRFMDICGGIVGCIITGVIYIFLAPVIKIKSPGPAIFAQTRVGQNGKPFQFYKFRSMYLDAEERKKELMAQNQVKDGMMFKMEFDPRIIGNYIDEKGEKHTGIGEFIRKTSLDEFPQFWNVLKGDMSLVGTRPPTIDEYEKYDAHHKARLAAKPGITGLWQVSGRSNILDFEEVVKLDTEYINNWSVGLDIRILIKTVEAVVKRDGAR